MKDGSNRDSDQLERTQWTPCFTSHADAIGGSHRSSGFAQHLQSQGAFLDSRQSARAAMQDEPQQGGNLRLGFLISQIVTLDPQQLSQGIVAGSILPSIFSSLVQFDEQLGLIPDLAETWTVSEDGMQYSFTLREGLTFHNGDSLTSADVQYTYERTTNPDFASPHANKLALVDSFEAPDERTVNLTLSKPFAPFLAVACTRGPDGRSRRSRGARSRSWAMSSSASRRSAPGRSWWCRRA
jgi:MarR-like DNA-binding transcriptional regulator SgrR of sgrS sRNA